MSEYLQAYLDETDEELETLVQALLTLEDDPRDENALNEAFRMMHSLKGSSGMMGFEGIADLAHHLESRFDRVRSGDAELDRDTMNVMLDCLDFFRVFITQLRAGDTTDEDGRQLIERLEKLEEKSPESPTTEFAAPAGPPGIVTMGGGYRVRITFQKGLQLADLKARLIVARLTNIGEILGSDPPIDDVLSSDDLPRFVVVLATNRSPSEVRDIANVDGVESVEIVGAGVQSPAATATVDMQTTDVDVADTAVARDIGESNVLPDNPTPDSNAERKTETGARRNTAELENKSRAVASAESADNAFQPAVPESATEPAPADDVQPMRPRVAETVRVEIDRLDRLMNLTGELVVTNARFNQIAGQMSPALRNARGAGRMSDLGERLRAGLDRIRQVGDERSGVSGYHRILDELDDDLASLEEQSTLWDEGRRHFTQIAEAVDQLTRVSKNLQKGVLDTRMVPVEPLFGRFKRVIRDLSHDRQKQVRLIIRGEKTELDKRMIDELGDPLLHLIRNSIDHGLESRDDRRAAGKQETGVIVLEASHSGNNVFVSVQDDGAGINVERVRSQIAERGLADRDLAASMTNEQVIDHIWHPGFSTAEQVTDVSGRGVGMDIVKSRIAELNGSIEVSTETGGGTTFQLRLPLTLAIIRSLMIRFRNDVFTIPIDDVREIVSISVDQVYDVHGRQTIDVRGEFIPLAGMDRVFQWHDIDYSYARNGESPENENDSAVVNVVVLQSRGKTLGLCVDELLGGADIVIKSLADNFISIRGLSGASIMGDGTVCLMLDTASIIEMM